MRDEIGDDLVFPRGVLEKVRKQWVKAVGV